MVKAKAPLTPRRVVGNRRTADALSLKEASAALVAMLSGEQEIAAAAMRQLRAKHARHNAVRVADLAYGTVDRVRVWIAWAWPRPLRSHPLTYVRSALRRGMIWLDRRHHAAEPLR